MTVRVFLLSETCSDAHTCLVPNDQHTQESLTPGVPREIQSIPEARTALGRSGFSLGHGRRHGHGDRESGRDFRISLGTPGVKLFSL